MDTTSEMQKAFIETGQASLCLQHLSARVIKHRPFLSKGHISLLGVCQRAPERMSTSDQKQNEMKILAMIPHGMYRSR